MGEMEAVADAVTGGVFARALEPKAGEGRGQAHGACLNCGTALIAEYCHSCGQNGHVHRTLSSIGHDLLHGVFHFEGKIWRTLPMLAFHPGALTRRYVAGERARFVSPLALFLFSVLLLATVLSSLPSGGFLSEMTDGMMDVNEKLSVAERDLDARRARLAGRRTGLSLQGRSTAAVDRQLAEIDRDREQLRRLRVEKRPFRAEAGSRGGEVAVGSLNARWRHAKENPQLLFYKLKTSAYKYSWVLVPISVPLIWLLFPFSRRFRLYDHAIFAIYSLSFMSLLGVALASLGMLPIPNAIIGAGFLFLPPIHMYRQLKGAYQLGRLGALLRTAMLMAFAWTAFIIWALLLIALGSG